uniref:glutamate formimidoyltransferase n=1 Tax=Neogobius melanostomus TaxID=47308 RepID=A0A8C6WHJ9_9GOBI
MARLVECVPNFSEGRDKEVIDAIARSISETEGVSLLDVDPGVSTNRTVYTFVGSPDAVVTGALNAARTAFERIDMSKHKGEHPRSGALDVCPFVPVQNVSMDDCVSCAEEFGQKLAEMLQVPVYLYGAAARCESRRSPLRSDLNGPQTSGPRSSSVWGATVTGARKFLIAFNSTSSAPKSKHIGSPGPEGLMYFQPGLLRRVQGMGWFLDESNLAQKLKLPVVGSQVVGLVPLQAILDTADFYIQRDQLFIVEEEHKSVISKLGLDSLGPFDPKQRIIDLFTAMIDEDADAFNEYMAALKMPKSTAEERTRRDAALQSGLQRAVLVPLSLARRVSDLWTPLKELCETGNAACQSDAQVAAKALEAAAFGAHYNVLINLRDITDQDFKEKTEKEASALLRDAQDNAAACLCVCEQRTSNS